MNVQVDTWLTNVTAKIARISSGRVVFLATTGTQLQVGHRTWDEGKLTSGAPITYKQDRPVYAYKPPMPRAVSGRGKPYDQWKRPPLTKAGTPRKGAAKIKGGFYPTYLDAKEDQGRRDTPFDLTSEYRKGYFSAAALVESPDGLTVELYLYGDNIDKWQGLTAQKGEHLKLSPEERTDHVRRMGEIWHGILSGDPQ